MYDNSNDNWEGRILLINSFHKTIFAIMFFSFNHVLPCCIFRTTVNITGFHSNLSFSGDIIDMVRTSYFRYRHIMRNC